MKFKTIKGVAAAAAIAVAAPAQAAEQDFELWTIGLANGTLTGKLLGSMEVSIRSSDEGTRSPTILLRPSLGVQVTKNLGLWLGYVRVSVNPDGRPGTRENRLFQQASWTIGKLGGGTLASRTRLEQRMLEERAITGWRVRQQFRWTKPLKRKGTSAVLSSEAFVALNTTDFGARPGLDQWRNFAGINLPVAKGLSLETGYMNRYVRRPSAVDRIDHIIPVTMAIRF